MEKKKLSPATLCVQAGWTPSKGEPRVLPIYQSTTFKYDTSEQMARLFDLEDSGYFYTRLQNPTNDAVAAKIAALEGGVGAMLTSSGQAANFYAIFNICQAGDHFVCASAIYGGTFNLFAVTMKKLGIECTFVDVNASEEELQKAFQPNTKALFGETISNPSIDVLDIEKFARVAHKNGVPLIVDNTFATPINCRPFEWGADIVTHSTTKYMDGHATAVGGVIVDSGNFDWDAHAEKFPGLTTPDESYHGLTYTKAFGKMAYMTKATAQLMRDLGSIQSPQNAFLLNLGLETLHLRVPRHCENAQKVAEWLEANPQVAWGNRWQPSIPFVSQGFDCSTGPRNISYRRSVSAPYFSTMVSGFTTLNIDLLIFSIAHPQIYLSFSRMNSAFAYSGRQARKASISRISFDTILTSTWSGVTS